MKNFLLILFTTFFSFSALLAQEESEERPLPKPTTSQKEAKAHSIRFPRPVPVLPRRYRDTHIKDISYLSVDQNLPSSYITDLTQDQEGNIWMATNGAGIVRYDGEAFQTFAQTEGLASNYITQIYEDRQKNLWVASNLGGLTRFDGRTMKIFNTQNGLASSKVYSITEGKQGELWVGTGNGLNRYVNGQFETFGRAEGLTNMDVEYLFFDSDERLWIGTFNGIFIYKNGLFINPDRKGILDNMKINNITEDTQGNIWIGTNGGLFKYTATFELLTIEDERFKVPIQKVYCDTKGRIWVGMYDGVSRISGTEIRHFTEADGLPNATVYAILDDKAGSIWLGTDGGGLCRLHENSFEIFTEDQGLSSAIVWHISEDSTGNFFLGTDAGGLDRYDGQTFSPLNEGVPFTDALVSAVYTDHKGYTWVATQGDGIFLYDPKVKDWQHFTEQKGDLADNIILQLEEDIHKGDIWFASNLGAIRYDGRQFTILDTQKGLPNNMIWSIKQDPNQREVFWIATEEGGLVRYDGQSFEVFNTSNGLPTNHIYHLYFDQKGRLWIGTDAGVILYDGKKFQYLTKGEEQGLLHNLILSFQGMPNGDIWIGTEGGLHWLKKVEDINQVPETKRVFGEYQNFTFTKQDGLKSLDAIDNAVFWDSKNRLWWGMGNALTRLDLNTFALSKEATKRPELLFVEIQQKYIDFSRLKQDTAYQGELKFGQELTESYATCDTFFNRPLDLNLPHNLNHLTFHFSSIDWAAPHKVKYSYRLLGLEEEWSLPSTQSSVDYRGLPANDYTLEVRAFGENHKWSPVMRYSFRIRPPIWNTAVAKLLYIIVLTVLIFGIISWRTRQLARREKQLKKVVESRTQDLSKANAQLSQTNEEIRTMNDSLQQTLSVVREQRDKIQDSINYAQRIQQAMLPTKKHLAEVLPEHFIFFRPRDVVSGDFYWLGDMRQVDGKIVLAAIDCTGHGVPGAFMSMIGNDLLNQIVNERHITDADQILTNLHLEVQSALNQKESRNRDGMDMSLIVIDYQDKTLSFAGAKNGLFYVQDGEPHWIKGDRNPIGGDWTPDKENPPFQPHQVSIEKPTFVYLYSDGFQDQFGGREGRKFMSKRFRELLFSLHSEPMQKQEKKLAETFNHWTKKHEQIDDVLVVGLFLKA